MTNIFFQTNLTGFATGLYFSVAHLAVWGISDLTIRVAHSYFITRHRLASDSRGTVCKAVQCTLRCSLPNGRLSDGNKEEIVLKLEAVNYFKVRQALGRSSARIGRRMVIATGKLT